MLETDGPPIHQLLQSSRPVVVEGAQLLDLPLGQSEVGLLGPELVGSRQPGDVGQPAGVSKRIQKGAAPQWASAEQHRRHWQDLHRDAHLAQALFERTGSAEDHRRLPARAIEPAEQRAERQLSAAQHGHVVDVYDSLHLNETSALAR